MEYEALTPLQAAWLSLTAFSLEASRRRETCWMDDSRKLAADKVWDAMPAFHALDVSSLGFALRAIEVTARAVTR